MSGPETLKEGPETHDNGSEVWEEMASSVDSFDPAAAEANRAKDVEKMEAISTDEYEKEIRALGDRFEEPNFLNETIELPSDMELVKEWVDKNQHAKEIQEWVQSASNSPEEQAYKKSLANAGFRKKMFYRSNPELLKVFDKAREDYKNGVLKRKTDEFLARQDRIERDVQSELKQYDTEPDNPVSEMKGDNLPLPSRLELVKSWIEGDTTGALDDVKNHADLIKEWLASDDGDDKEKRYRALTRVRLGDSVERWGRHSGELEKSSVHETMIPYNLHQSGFYKDMSMSSKYSSLSDEEKKKKWEEAKVEFVDKLKESRNKKGPIAAAGDGTPEENLKKEGRRNNEQKPTETVSLPNRGPNPMSPLFDEYPMDPFGTMFNGD